MQQVLSAVADTENDLLTIKGHGLSANDIGEIINNLGYSYKGVADFGDKPGSENKS